MEPSALAQVRLAVVCPTKRGVQPPTVFTIAEWVLRLSRMLGYVELSFPYAMSCALGRGHGTAQALDSARAFTHILSLDDDVSANADVVLRMLGCDAPVVGVNYRVKSDNPNVVDYAAKLRLLELAQVPRQDGTIATDFVPGGLCLWRRDALERLDAVHARFRDAEHGAEICSFFMELVAPDGVYCTEDVSACARYRALGGEVRMLLDADVGHHDGTRHYEGNFYRDVWQPLGGRCPLE